MSERPATAGVQKFCIYSSVLPGNLGKTNGAGSAATGRALASATIAWPAEMGAARTGATAGRARAMGATAGEGGARAGEAAAGTGARRGAAEATAIGSTFERARAGGAGTDGGAGVLMLKTPAPNASCSVAASTNAFRGCCPMSERPS